MMEGVPQVSVSLVPILTIEEINKNWEISFEAIKNWVATAKASLEFKNFVLQTKLIDDLTLLKLPMMDLEQAKLVVTVKLHNPKTKTADDYISFKKSIVKKFFSAEAQGSFHENVRSSLIEQISSSSQTQVKTLNKSDTLTIFKEPAPVDAKLQKLEPFLADKDSRITRDAIISLLTLGVDFIHSEIIQESYKAELAKMDCEDKATKILSIISNNTSTGDPKSIIKLLEVAKEKLRQEHTPDSIILLTDTLNSLSVNELTIDS